MEKNNPLGLDPKREKSGGLTFSKYNYQYHWAFCRMLDEYESENEFALFIEEHEDITIASSLDVDLAFFELNQVKATSKRHTIKSLTKSEPDSIIEKLASSSCGKSYSDQISKINFVSTGGYSFELHKKGFHFEVINSGQLSEDEAKEVKDCISHLEGASGFCDKLAFIIPDLPEKGFDHVVEGRISALISNMASGFKYDSNAIYNCIIRDLNRKGENTFDYENWDDAIRKKAVTSHQLSAIVEQHINRKPDENIVIELMQILDTEYSLGSIARRRIVKAFNRYYTKRVASRDKVVNEISTDIVSKIKDLSQNYSNAKDLEQATLKELKRETISYFQNNEDLTGAFLYEFLEGVEL